MNLPGKVTGRVLVLDFDDVILDSERLIDKEIAKSWYTASDRYARKLNKRFENNTIKTRDELDSLLEEYYDKKNQMLEEVYPHLEGRINYGKIINDRNLSPLTVQCVRDLIASERYDMVIIESHYNSNEEKKCKEILINKLFKGAFFLPVKFFEQDYLEYKEKELQRVKTSKAEYIMAYLDYNGIEYDFSLFTLIDNSPSNIRDWIKCGGIGLVYGNNASLLSIQDLSKETIAAAEDRFMILNENSDNKGKH